MLPEMVYRLKNLKHAYLPNDKALSSKKGKIGVEHAKTNDIKLALENLYEPANVKGDYKMEDLINLGIYQNKERRKLFCDYLNIAFGNNKKVLAQLNYFNIDKIKNAITVTLTKPVVLISKAIIIILVLFWLMNRLLFQQL